MNGFKQAGLVLIDKKTAPNLAGLTHALEQCPVPPLLSATKRAEGFTPPYAFSELLVYPAASSWKIRLTARERLLPNTVVKAALEDKIKDLESTEGRLIGKREKKELKDLVYRELLARAFIQDSHIEAIYRPESGFLLINQSSQAKIQQFLSQLRPALGGLTAKLPATKISPAVLMTSWLQRGYADGHFVLADYCELKRTADVTSTVKFAKHELPAAEVSNLLGNQRFVSRLGLIWQDKIQFVWDEDFTVNNIKFLDLTDNAPEEPAAAEENPALTAEAEQLLLSSGLGQIYTDLTELAGGWQ